MSTRLEGVSQSEAALAEEIGSPLLAIEYSEDGRLVDFLNPNILLEDYKEERRRQQYLRILHYEYGYPKEQMRREFPINIGSSAPIFADIAVFRSVESARENDQGQIRFCVEVKRDTETEGHNQLVSYVFFTSSEGAVWTNAETVKYYRRFDAPEHRLEGWNGIPALAEDWDAVGRLSKAALRKPRDIKALLRRCHQRLFRAGIESEDLAMDMVRIILAKWRDEVSPEPATRFYCTSEEYRTPPGRDAAARRVQELFAEVRNQNLEVFESDEDISAPPDHVAEVVTELQRYRLLVDEDEWWDVLGAAYEQYTAAYFRQTNGQYFTNRLVVHLMVEMVNPTTDDVVLDPAGGSGGFITAAVRHIRKSLAEQGLSAMARQQLFDQVRRSIGMIEKASRLVKVAKTAAILTGDGHDNFYQGDSLRPLTDQWFPANFLGRFGEHRPSLILTNPPYAGTTEGRIDDPEILRQFDVAKIWRDGIPTTTLSGGGTPPELLFLERSINWLRPGGRMAIVIARGMLDTSTALSTRRFIFAQTRVRAVVALNKDTFQPHTGVRTCVLLVEKSALPPALEHDYPIFMAISRKIGQDSEGVPVFKVDDQGRETEELDHDLGTVLNAYRSFQQDTLTPSEFIFTVRKSELDQDSLNINPQHYLPTYNESIARVLRIGDQDGWTTRTIGNIDPHVFKGARFRRQNLETDSTEGSNIEPFFTPSVLLQDRADSVKYLDLSTATERQRDSIAASRALEGELLITRSGSIGRVIYVNKALAGKLISDDLIHIRIEDGPLRYYIYMVLKNILGQHQMLRNEYGSVQTHLEPTHVRDIIIPLPEDHNLIMQIANPIRLSIKAKERSWEMEDQARRLLNGIILDPVVEAAAIGDEEAEPGDLTKATFERLLHRASQPIQAAEEQSDPGASGT